MKDKKLVSVIMGIYNCHSTLPLAIDSILSQTYANWELIMCDDCSTDDTYLVARMYEQKYPDRILLVKNEMNSGLAYSLNHCLRFAKGFYVARMDADDYCAKDRFEKQIDFLETHAEFQSVGSLMQRFNDRGLSDVMRVAEFPDYFSLRNDPPFFHATIMTYKEVFDKLNGYAVLPRTIRGQDYDLWFRFYHLGYKGANLQEVLYFVREDEKAIRRRTAGSRWRILQTRIMGYKLLNYPRKWLFGAVAMTLIKMALPYFCFDWYRNFQAWRRRS